MKSRLPLLIIPYEILVREIDGCVILAYEYAKKGGVALIGQKQALFPIIRFLKNSIWFLKSIVPGEVIIQKRIYKNKSKVFSYDVEGLVPSEGEIGILERFSKDSLKLTEYHFCWNKEEQKRYVNLFPNFKEKFIDSGIPIQESWFRYPKTSNKKNTVLFASSFPLVGRLQEKYSKERTLKASGNNGAKMAQLEKEICMQNSGKFYTEKFIDFLLEKGMKVKIRKHPAELGNIWDKYCNNPKVSFDDFTKPIAYSIVNSDFLILFNSTVSVQANYMGKMSFQYFPNKEIKKYKSTFSKIVMNYSNTLNCLSEFDKPDQTLIDKKKIVKNKKISKTILGYMLSSFKERNYYYNRFLLQVISPFFRLKRLIIFLLSQQQFFQRTFPNRVFSPLYYEVGKNKAPLNTFESVKQSISNMELKSKKIKLKKITHNLIEFSLSKT